MKKTLTAVALFCLFAGPAQCATATEIVITGSRIPDYNGVPHVMMPRRADFVLRDLQVDCDTRDKAQRINEIKSTLRAMIAAAGGNILLGVRGESGDDEFVLPLTEDRFDQYILADTKRPDANYVVTIVKSPILAQETSERLANARIEAFVKGIKGVGRSTLALDRDFALSVVDPEQYRGGILKLIAADARGVAGIFESGYGAEVRSIQRRVLWMRTGPIDLALYLPYELNVVPAK